LKFLWISLGVLAFLLLLCLLTAYICFRMAFYSSRSKKKDPDAIPLPSGEIYEEYHKSMTGWIRIGDKTYHFSKKGVMLTGTHKISKKKYTFSETGELVKGKAPKVKARFSERDNGPALMTE